MSVRQASFKAVFLSLLLLLLVYSSHVTSKVYQIKSLSTDTCPAGESCPLTLSQFVDQSETYLDDNTTLIFQSGNHSLQSVLFVSNITMLSLHAHSSNIVIMCNGLGRFELSSIRFVHVINLMFIGCPGNRVDSVHQFTLEDSTFIGQGNVLGTALELIETTASLCRNTYISNSGKQHSMGRISYPYPNNIAQVWAGGAILSTSSNINITESIFEENHAGVGGAIFSEFYSNITSVNSTFIGNLAKTSQANVLYIPGGGVLNAVDGGTVIIHNSQFVNNSALGGGGGGVLSAVRNVIITIDCSQFVNNSALGAYGKGGGVLYAAEAVDISINSSFFVNNHGDRVGCGVANIEVDVDLVVTHSQFTNNSCVFGAVISALKSANVAIDYSHFVNNIAAGEVSDGGVIVHAWKEVNISINHSDFINNTGGDGGIVNANDHVDIIINDSRFINNSCTAGGILYNLAEVNTTITHSEFIGNHANKGGVIFVFNGITANVSFVNVSQCHFVSNTGNGGVFYVGYNVKLIISFSEFTKNSAVGGRGKGGVMWAEYTVDVTITHSKFISNGATDDYDDFEAPVGYTQSASYGGGVLYAGVYVNITITHSLFIGNKAASSNGDGGVIFSLGHLDYQNVLFSVNHDIINITHSFFSGNSALGVHGGGVVYAASSSKKCVFISDNTLILSTTVL